MIADELNQNDIDALLSGLGGGDEGDDAGGGDDLAGLMGDDSGAAEADVASGGGNDSVDLPEFETEEEDQESSQSIQDLLTDVMLKVKIRLGRTQMYIEDILKLNPGKVVKLDSLSGDPVDILVNDRVVAKGEVIILNEAFCVRVTEIFTTQDKLERQS